MLDYNYYPMEDYKYYLKEDYMVDLKEYLIINSIINMDFDFKNYH